MSTQSGIKIAGVLIEIKVAIATYSGIADQVIRFLEINPLN